MCHKAICNVSVGGFIIFLVYAVCFGLQSVICYLEIVIYMFMR